MDDLKFDHLLIKIKQDQKILESINLSIIIKNIGPFEGNFLHYLAMNKETQILKKLLLRNLQSIFYLNVRDENVINILYDDLNMVLWILKTYPRSEIENIFNNISYDQETVLTKNIKDTQNKNDLNYEIIKNIINFIDLNQPMNNPPLILIAKENKNHLLELFYYQKALNIEIKDQQFKTGLIWALENNNMESIKFFLDKGANINYTGLYKEFQIIKKIVKENNEHLLDLMIKNKYNLDEQDLNLDTLLHEIFGPKKMDYYNTHENIKRKILFLGNVNIQNINGDTVIHYLCKDKEIFRYHIILKKKQINFYIKNNNNEMALSYLNPNENIYIMRKIINSMLDKKNLDVEKGKYTYKESKELGLEIEEFNNKPALHTCEKINKKKKLNKIAKKILEKKNSRIEKKEILKIIKTSDTDIGIFNSDTIHNIIYMIYLLKKYKNVMVPFQYLNIDKIINENNKYEEGNLLIGGEKIIKNILEIYKNILFEIEPYVIIWKNRQVYFINSDLELYLKKLEHNEKIRFIIIKLTIITSEATTHANLIIYDKKNKTLERFEPYGNMEYNDKNEMKKLMSKISYKFEYVNEIINPDDLQNNIGFQTISKDNDPNIKNYGDPMGYCLAWTFWYLEMRINNEIEPKKLTRKIIKYMSNEKKENIEPEKKILSIIRGYGRKLDKIKNDFLLKSGIPKERYYNMTYNIEDIEKIKITLRKEFNEIINERKLT